jgi:membrane-associated phospholipid phosphatase
VTLGYLLATSILFVLFRENFPYWLRAIVLHVAIAAVTVWLVAWASRNESPALRFARAWYPFLLFIFFFEELHYISHLIVPRWQDALLLRFDYALFGVHPTVWLQQFASTALNDTMQLFYMTYYFYTVMICAVLFARKEMPRFWTVINATAIADTIGYAIALLLPMEGPYHTLRALHTVELEGGIFTAVIGVVQNVGRVHGAAFPSLHVAGAFVAVLAAWRYLRGMFWVFLPLFVGMMVSTVYGRYHYFADIPGGLMIGAIGWAIAGSQGSQRGEGSQGSEGALARQKCAPPSFP